MSGTKSYTCNYHKKRRDFRIISEIRQWIIDFWYNFIKRLKNVLSERRLSRIQSPHTKSITNISTHLSTHFNTEKKINCLWETSRIKSPVKLKKSRKNKRKIRKSEELFEELSDDYLALYRKKSCHHLASKRTNSGLIDTKRSFSSIKSRKSKTESKHSEINVMVQEVTQKYFSDGFIDDLNWLPKFFGCTLPPNSTSKIDLRKIDNDPSNNHTADTINKPEITKIKKPNDYKRCSKIPRYQHQHNFAAIKPKPKIPYSKHHKNCINN